jgi:ketosteroid isomerase-like protein
MAGDEAAVRQAVIDYVAAFSKLDAAATARYYHEPSMFLRPNGVTLMASRAEIEATFAANMESLRAREYSHSEWLELYVKQLSETTALASGVAIRYKTDGSELERVGATYALRRTDDGWKIVMTLGHPIESVLRLEKA